MKEDHIPLLEEYAAVQQALAELASIYNDAPIGLGVIGTDFRFKRLNARLAEINGASIEAHLGRTIREVVPKLADLAESLVRKVVESGEPIINLEIEGETSAEPGVIRSFVEHWSPLHGPDGDVVAINVVVEDVTARKRAAEALRASEARLREVLDSIKDAFLVMDHEYRIIQMNREALRIDGRPLEQLLGRTHLEAWPASIGTPVDQAYRRVMTERVPVSLQHHYVFGAHDVWLDISAYPTSDGIALFYRDISEGKQAEERLKESESRFSTALRAGQLGVFEFFYRRDRAYYWDSTVRRIWGVGADAEVTDALFWSSVHPDDVAKVRYASARASVAKGPRRYDVEYRIFRRHDNALRWVKVSSDVAFDEAGPVKMIGTIHDITDRKLAEERTEILMREVNHRSKNLLAVVQSIAQQMARTSDPETFAQRFAERLAGLSACHDLLVHSQWTRVDLRALVTSQLAHYQHLIGERIRFAGSPMLISAGAAQNLGMALHELATNAAKYGALSDKGGVVTIAWMLRPGNDGNEFTLSWTEENGPAVKAPERRGLGSDIITRLLERAVRGQVALEFAPLGLKWSLAAPARALLEEEERENPPPAVSAAERS